MILRKTSIFLSQSVVFRQNPFLQLFASIHRPFLNQESVFSLRKFFIFASIHQLHSLNQGQDNLFMKFFLIFASIHQLPELGSRKHFHAPGMHSINFPHKITLIWVIFSLKNFSVPKIFSHSKITKMHFFTHPVKIHKNKNLPWPVCRYLPNNLLVHNVS